MLCFYNSIHPNSDKPKPNPIHRTVVGAGPRACPVNGQPQEIGQPQGVAPTQKYFAIFDHNLTDKTLRDISKASVPTGQNLFR